MTTPLHFHTSSGFAEVCTGCSTHRRHKAAPSPRRHPSLIRSVLLALFIGTALAAVLFIGLSGGFRP